MGLPHKSKSLLIGSFVLFFVLFCGLVGGGFFPVFSLSTGAIACETTAVSTPVMRTLSAGQMVMVSGAPIGLRMQSEGVVVTGYIGFLASNQTYVSPAKDAGLRVGDRILSIDGEPVTGTDFLVETVADGSGKTQILLVERDGNTLSLPVRACQEAETEIYKLGLWVKDGAAGIGTLTFYDPTSGFFGALGHGITDAGSGALYTISGGQLLHAAITDVVKGKVGVPGELRGYFSNSRQSLGVILGNRESGVYGYLEEPDKVSLAGKKMRIAPASSVHTGAASIWTTLDSGEPREYQIAIDRVNLDKCHSTKGLVIHMVDPTLLDVSGGIVQGMSGSPIVQDGCLVGAVTHVLVNDPTTGYGIFIENMLETAE